MTPFETFLSELAKVLQFPNLAPDAQGACLIVMKESQIPLLFEWDDHLVPHTVLVSTLVCPIPIDRKSEVYEALLSGNSEIENTLSVKPDEDLLYLHRRLHPEIQAPDLEKILFQFIDTVTLWKSKVATIAQKPPRAYHFPPHPASIQVFPYKA